LEEVWEIDNLLEVIQNEVEAREASEGAKMNSARQPSTGQKFSSNSGATTSLLFSRFNVYTVARITFQHLVVNK